VHTYQAQERSGNKKSMEANYEDPFRSANYPMGGRSKPCMLPDKYSGNSPMQSFIAQFESCAVTMNGIARRRKPTFVGV